MHNARLRFTSPSLFHIRILHKIAGAFDSTEITPNLLFPVIRWIRDQFAIFVFDHFYWHLTNAKTNRATSPFARVVK